MMTSASPRRRRSLTARITGATLALFACAAWGQSGGACGDPFTNHFGPFDYRTAPKDAISIVERIHFTSNVEMLKRGASTSRIGADISYTLKVFPNHPRALLSMAELSRRQKRLQPIGSEFDLECWFDRAIRFRPDDAAVRLVFGIALLRDAKYGAALEQLTIAEKAMPNNPDVHYNMGLAYVNAGDYDQALAHAKRAYDLGHPLPGLRDLLKKAGRWK